jgi:N-formylglutamate deformylase
VRTESQNRATGRAERGDETLESLYAEPFRIVRPLRQTVPFVFASPHSGSLYPESFVQASRLSPVSLRRSEDAFVDELFAGSVVLGAPLLAARFPRAFLDVNRAPDELDQAMFEGPLSVAVDAPSARVAAGLGVVPRIVRDGAEIYKGRIAAREAEERLLRLYRPYHAALAGLVEETRAHFGAAVVIDCHSMPSAAAAPDIVLGDRYGASAAPMLTRHTDAAFQRHGFSVARNAPYAGGHTTLLHGRRDRDVHALQIEINRTLYLDEERIVRGARFADVHARLTRALMELVTIELHVLRRARPNPRLAAE